MARHDEVQVELVCTDRRVDLIEEGFDLAIRAGELDDSSLVARRLGQFKRVLVAAPGYCKQHGTPRTPADLSKHACLAFGAGARPAEWTLLSDGKKATVRVTPRLTVNDFEILRAAAHAGQGIASLPDFTCAGDVSAGRLRRVLAEWHSAETPVHALYPTARHLLPKVGRFVELLQERLRLT
jgi:DNA-binding transcriptional LysR family regulator